MKIETFNNTKRPKGVYQNLLDDEYDHLKMFQVNDILKAEVVLNRPQDLLDSFKILNELPNELFNIIKLNNFLCTAKHCLVVYFIYGNAIMG